MHTAHLLTVSPSMHSAGGVPGQGGCLLWGVPGQGGGVWYPSMHWGKSPLWTEFLTHATENITLTQTSFAGGKNINIYFKQGSVQTGLLAIALAPVDIAPGDTSPFYRATDILV